MASSNVLENQLFRGQMARWDSLEQEQCSVARTVAVIGDRWSVLILRDCFLRVRRFEEFQSRLGAPRHILADRLKKLVHFGVLRRAPYQVSTVRGPRSYRQASRSRRRSRSQATTTGLPDGGNGQPIA